MDWFNIISAIISMVATLVSVGIPAFIALKKAWNARKTAETDAAKEKADAELLALAKNFIHEAEVAYDGFDKVMKTQNSSAGKVKKENVFTKLQAHALYNGYEFDADEWSAKIDSLVEFTKGVNAKKIS